MMNPGKIAITLLMTSIFAASLSACEKKQASDDKGPAEKAGQQIDQAASRAGEELNKLAGKAGHTMEQAGRNLQKEAAQKSEAQKKE